MSEAMLAMALDLDVGRHKQELAQSFSEARARLVPPELPQMTQLQRMAELQNAYFSSAGLMNHLQPSLNQLQAANQAAPVRDPYYTGEANVWDWLFGSPTPRSWF